MKLLLPPATASSDALALISTTQAALAPKDFYAPRDHANWQAGFARQDSNGCEGLLSGSAHPSCGTRTGGLH